MPLPLLAGLAGRAVASGIGKKLMAKAAPGIVGKPGIFGKMMGRSSSPDVPKAPDAPDAPDTPKVSLLSKMKGKFGALSQKFDDLGPGANALAAPGADAAVVASEPAVAVAVASPSASDGAPPMALNAMAHGLNEAFDLFYRYMSYFALTAIVGLFVLSVIDIIVFYKRAWKQRIQLAMEPNLLNKDTNEFGILAYNNNDVNNEPYTLFVEQYFLKFLFLLVSAFLIVFFSQIIAFVCLKLWAQFRGLVFDEKITITPQYSIAIFVAGLSALIMSIIYKFWFVQKMQPRFGKYQGQLDDIQNFVYPRMTQNAAFLEAMRMSDMTRVIDLMKNEPTVYGTQKMIFTLNLYNFYKSTIPETDEAYTEVMQMFTPAGIRQRTVSPANYLYFNQKRFMVDTYPTLKDSFKDVLTSEQQQKLIRDLRTDNFAMNKMILRLRLIQGGPKVMRSLIWVRFMTSFAFLALMAMVFREQSQAIIDRIKPALKMIWDKIGTKLNFMFMS